MSTTIKIMNWKISVGLSLGSFVLAFGYAYLFDHDWWSAFRESLISIVTLASAHGSHNIANRINENSSNNPKS